MQASVSTSPWSCMDEHAPKDLDLLTSCISSRCSAALTVLAAGLGALIQASEVTTLRRAKGALPRCQRVA
jgi:hypothetical protein